MKKCSKCGEMKPLSSYYRAGGNYLRGDCIPCNLATKAERHRLNPEPARRRTKEWQAANPDRVTANREAFVASGGTKGRRTYSSSLRPSSRPRARTTRLELGGQGVELGCCPSPGGAFRPAPLGRLRRSAD